MVLDRGFVNSIVVFKHNDIDYFALCVGRNKYGKLICYRAIKKVHPKVIDESMVEDTVSHGVVYFVDFRCKFCIPPNCLQQTVLGCGADFVEQINQKYASLPPLEVQIHKYKDLKKQFYHAADKEKHGILRQMSELDREIRARLAVFLEGTPRENENSDKYRNFRIVPDKKGISRIYGGGSCSGKK